MGSKDDILTAIRRNLPQSFERPDLAQDWTTYDDPTAQFAEILAGVGGVCVSVASLDEVQEHLRTIPAYNEGKEICHAVVGLPKGTVNLGSYDDPHQLETIDFAVLPGQFAVAENAAVWVNTRHFKHRVVYFIAQHIALVVPASQVVNNMHEAYERLSFEEAGYGVFISGPSKTADIEQSLVIGAHGARSQIVYLVDDLPS